MRVLVTGSRDWKKPNRVFEALTMCKYFANDDLIVIHGDCPTGADRYADLWAEAEHLSIERYPANWKSFGKLAGPIRNTEMVNTKPDICLAFVRPESKGTLDCKKKAEDAGIRTFVFHEGYDA